MFQAFSPAFTDYIEACEARRSSGMQIQLKTKTKLYVYVFNKKETITYIKKKKKNPSTHEIRTYEYTLKWTMNNERKEEINKQIYIYVHDETSLGVR